AGLPHSSNSPQAGSAVVDFHGKLDRIEGCRLQAGDRLPIIRCATLVSGRVQVQGEIKLSGPGQTFLIAGNGLAYLLERKRVVSSRQVGLFELPQEVVRGVDDIQQPVYLSFQMVGGQHLVTDSAVSVGRVTKGYCARTFAPAQRDTTLGSEV